MENIMDLNTNLYQRRVLGVLCALLAPACLIFGFLGLGVNLPGWYHSISDTYYANDKIFMIGLLFATSVFFFTYKGYDWRDRMMSLIQAVSALGVIVFPCSVSGAGETTGLFNLKMSTSSIFHCASAGILFGTFAINILWLFTKSGGEMTDGKKKRNRVYKICGWTIIVVAISQIIEGAFFSNVIGDFPYIWLNEFIMLVAFSVAWLVKGEAIKQLNDK
jgi:hypothetical protein